MFLSLSLCSFPSIVVIMPGLLEFLVAARDCTHKVKQRCRVRVKRVPNGDKNGDGYEEIEFISRWSGLMKGLREEKRREEKRREEKRREEKKKRKEHKWSTRVE